MRAALLAALLCGLRRRPAAATAAGRTQDGVRPDARSEKRAQIRLQLAVGYYQDGKYEIALDEVKQAIAADPDYADAYGMRALIYTAMGETALADENYRRALRLAPNNPGPGQQLRAVPVRDGGRPARGDGAISRPR